MSSFQAEQTSQAHHSIHYMKIIINAGDLVSLLVGRRTCDLQVEVRVLAGHHCVMALGKLLTPMCLCPQAV